MSDENCDVACDLCQSEECDVVLEKKDTFYVLCRQCGFVYTNPRVQVTEANSEYFPAVRDHCVASNYSALKQQAYAKQLRKLSKYRQTNRILAVGCNVGGFVYRAQEMGWHATGIEPARECAEYAQKIHNLNVLPQYLEDANLPAERLDVVYSNAVFEHPPSPRTVIREIARILRPGGIVYIKTVNWNSYTREQMGADSHLLLPRYPTSLFASKTLPQLCTEAGMSIVSIASNGVRLPKRNGITNRGKKKFLSTLARFTLKGDRIIVVAQKQS